MTNMDASSKEFLFRLLETPSPTGQEMLGQRCWAQEVQQYADQVECDAYGSTWAMLSSKKKSRKGSQKTNPKTLMLEAHADEIGFMIKHITPEGFLRLERVGGSDVAVARGHRLSILGSKGTVLGVIGNTAIHLRSGKEDQVPKVQDLWVDIGAKNPEEVQELGVRVGHFAVYVEGPTELANGHLVSRALDNRIGGYILSEVMKRVAKKRSAKNKKNEYALLCLNAVQEEIGGNGAKMATYRLMPDIAICFDVTHATDTPGISQDQFGKVLLGGGPALAHGGANHPLVVKRLMEVAEEEGIPIQHEAISRYTGTDTDTIFTSQQGIPSALVSLPLRSMHSAVETASLKDIEWCISLMTNFVLSLSEEDQFNHQLDHW